MQSLFYFIITSDLNRKISTMIFSCILFGIMFFLMFYSQYIYYINHGDWAQELCAPHQYWYIFFGVCLWIAAFGIILKKCLE